MKPLTGSASRSIAISICLFLSYALLLSLCVPFVMPRGKAATAALEKRTASSSARKPDNKAESRAGELLVRFRDGVSDQEKTTIVLSKGAHRGHKLRGQSEIEKLELPIGQSPEAFAAELLTEPLVEFAEPNFLIHHNEIVPNDPHFGEQWALQNTGQNGGIFGADINVKQAWETTTGSYRTVIAVIDSGIDFTHPDLKDAEWTNQSVWQGGDLHGWDYVTDTGEIKDEQGHGTAIAGIVAAQGNNAVGITGVMWHASLMSLRVLDRTGTGDIGDAVEAIDYAVAHGAQVINLSWGTDSYSAALKDAIERAGRNGVLVICSAGNDGQDIDTTPYYPASFDAQNLIAVAATDNSDHLMGWSNYGTRHVAIAAPGVNLLTTQMGGGYQLVSGTSAAAPLVTGIVGLLKTAHPYLNAQSSVAAIMNGARQLPSLVGKISSGGVASAASALGAIHGKVGDNGPTPSPSPGSGNSGNGQGGGNGEQRGPIHEPKNEKKGGSRGAPTPIMKGAPGPNLPDLTQLRKQKSAVPESSNSTTIHSNLVCADCGDTVAGNGYYPSNDRFFANARLRPINRTGLDNNNDGGGGIANGVRLGSRNFSWSAPLLSLPGRAGMDLGLALTYNSLVWTKDSSYIKFNADHGFPGPGFQMGFPILQQSFYDYSSGQWSYIMVSPSGGRTEFRPSPTANIYESADSSYTQLDMTGGTPVVRTMDGTQLFFGSFISGLNEYRCTQIEDHNGNLINASYDGNGHLQSITDTLGRVVTFNYNADQNLTSITQPWSGMSHPAWAQFEYGSLTLQPSFYGLYVNMPANGMVTVLTKVTLSDGSYFTFEYNSYGQVYLIRHWAADAHQLAYTSYVLDSGPNLTDCPRVNERHDWAENWSGVNGVPNEAIAYFSVDPGGAWSQVTMPDGTVYKETFATSGWQKGLTIQSDIYSADNLNTAKKTTTNAWTQDNTSANYQINPRVYETNIYDSNGNHRRTSINYTTFTLPTGASCSLPADIVEYAADAVSQLRKTHTDYRYDSLFLSRRLIGLPAAKYIYDGANNLQAKTVYDYDWPNWPEHLQATPTAPTQHDEANFGPGTAAGRGNLVLEQRWGWDDTNPYQFTKTAEYKWGYYTTGTVAFTRDPLGHQTKYEYSDSNGGNTYAYPTAITDPDQIWAQSPLKARMWYNYDFGGVIQAQGLPPQGSTQGPIQTTTYDNVGRIQQITKQFGGNTSYSHTRFVYSASMTNVQTFTSLVSDTVEAYSAQFFDGAGRVRATASDHPYSNGGYSGQYIYYDVMGRAVLQSNPTEMNSAWTPVGDDSAWLYTQQQYDWKDRPTVLTHPGDNYQQINTYGGCGCAGGEVVTEQDEAGRQRRLTMDVLGRLKQVEELNADGSVYSTTQYEYNALDQLTRITQQGDRVRTFEYDGFGRLWHRTTPEQGTTTYTYNLDDTPATVTDARGAKTSFSYNNSRHLVNDITYDVSQVQPAVSVPQTPAVHYDYDVAGNRTYMSDGQGSTSYSYDQLSRLTSETRYFSALNRSYTLTYSYYPSGQLSSVTNPFGVSFSYGRDKTGRINSVGGSGYVSVPSYVSNIYYRAFGAPKQVSYGNSLTLSLSYDQRLRLTRWDIPGRLGYDYYYNDFQENTDRVTFASSRNGDSRLDHSYDYDQFGRLLVTHTSSEARAHTGRGSFNGLYDGPYSQAYGYDVWGNLTHREGWGGENANYDLTFNSQNRRNGSTYDLAGNITSDGGQSFTYDATGQAVSASFNGLQMFYDGDGLRVRRVQDGYNAYYVRSSVLGGQVIADLDSNGNWMHGYVYMEGQLLAYQENGRVLWVHEDPITKGKRMTDASGAVTMSVELDPWGGQVSNSNWTSNAWLQPHLYTTYERDGNQSDEAMARRYNRWWSRFDQPDPSHESYDLSDPQSLNRYSYVQNDPVNLTDPTGLDASSGDCVSEYNATGKCTIGSGSDSIPVSLAYLIWMSMTSINIIPLIGPIDIGGGGGQAGTGNQQKHEQGTTCFTVNAAFPNEPGQGYFRYSPRTGSNLAGDPGLLNYAQPGVIATIINFASDWNQIHPNNPIGVGDLGKFGGGFSKRHPGGGHAGGTIIDIRPMSTNGGTGDATKTEVGAPNYNRALTNELVQRLFQTGSVEKILFNDTKNIKGVRYAKGHDNHLHVVFKSGTGCQH